MKEADKKSSLNENKVKRKALNSKKKTSNKEDYDFKEILKND